MMMMMMVMMIVMLLLMMMVMMMMIIIIIANITNLNTNTKSCTNNSSKTKAGDSRLMITD